MITEEVLQSFYRNELTALPVVFNLSTRVVDKHPEHDPAKVTHGLTYALALNTGYMSRANGIALKLTPPWGMLDFDLKNTDDKTMYDRWFKGVVAVNEDVFRKVCIEKTRNGGYHVYFKYNKLERKLTVARSLSGEEKISIYTGGLLSYCSPSPGYEIIHNDWGDIDFINDDEYDLLISTAAVFNEDAPGEVSGSRVTLMEYPTEYENLCLQFDDKCTDDVFDQLLNQIGLWEVPPTVMPRKAKQHFIPYLRRGSSAAYSAKAYFKSKRLLIFSGSMKQFPTWADYDQANPGRWSLSPSKIVFYKNDKDWLRTVQEIKIIVDSAGIDIIEPTRALPVLAGGENRMRFPYDVFPAHLQDFIYANVIQHEYLAGALLAAVSAALGNSVTLNALDGYKVKAILYLAIVAPPGSFKSPALKTAFAPLERYDNFLHKQFVLKHAEYLKALGAWNKSKKAGAEPAPPNTEQVIIKDSTIEMVMQILSVNPGGCVVVADELSGFLKRMNQYKSGDDVQKWLELWDGGTTRLQRISRAQTYVESAFCSIIGGIQPGVLEGMSAGDNANNGFYHRFLFVYPTPHPKAEWKSFSIPESVKAAFNNGFIDLIGNRTQECAYVLSAYAEQLYTDWFNGKNAFYNKAQTDDVRGIISKYQGYCLRFALIIQAAYEGAQRSGIIEGVNMERAIRLTEYFFANMHKATRILAPESELDKLQERWVKLYEVLPPVFTVKNLVIAAEKIGINSVGAKSFLIRKTGALFTKVERGVFEKLI